MKALYTDLRHLAGMVAGAEAITRQLPEGGDVDSLLNLLEATGAKMEELLCEVGELIARSETPAPE